ncbi:hypothetical protein HDU81_003959 [Chytriomyces hyalinus]|nr:hypothetical protein HDU81_003959 [Chytriomyces hyalinus]
MHAKSTSALRLCEKVYTTINNGCAFVTPQIWVEFAKAALYDSFMTLTVIHHVASATFRTNLSAAEIERRMSNLRMFVELKERTMMEQERAAIIAQHTQPASIPTPPSKPPTSARPSAPQAIQPSGVTSTITSHTSTTPVPSRSQQGVGDGKVSYEEWRKRIAAELPATTAAKGAPASKGAPAATPLPKPPLTATSAVNRPSAPIANVPKPPIVSPDISFLLNRVETTYHATTDMVAIWKTSSTPGSIYAKRPSPWTTSFVLTRQMINTVFDFSAPLPASDGKSEVRSGVLIWWHFSSNVKPRDGETGSSLPNGLCTLSVGGGAGSSNLGSVHSSTDRIDITQALKANSSIIRRDYAANRQPTIALTVNFTQKSMISAAHCAIVVHRRLDASECVSKLYENVAAARGLVPPVAKASEKFANASFLVPKVTRSFEELKGLVVRMIAESPRSKALAAKDANQDDVECGDSTITFSCPLSLKRISVPAKGKNCKHRQAFDAEELMLDLDMIRLLNKYPTSQKCIVKSDGSDCDFDSAPPKPTASTTHGQSTTFTISDDPIPKPTRTSSTASSIHSVATPSQTNGGSEKRQVICLLDSDDDEPLASVRKRRRTGENTSSVSKQSTTFPVVATRSEGGRVIETIILD